MRVVEGQGGGGRGIDRISGRFPVNFHLFLLLLLLLLLFCWFLLICPVPAVANNPLQISFYPN